MTPPKTSTPNNAWTSPFKPRTVECAVSPMEKSADLFNVSKGIEDSIEKSVSKTEEKMYEVTTRKKLFQREKDRLPIECRTTGKSIFLMPLSKPQKSTKECSKTSIYQRTMVLDNVRQFIAGPSSEDADAQLKNEIKTLGKLRNIDKTKSEKLLIDEKDALVIKEELGLSWRENGKMRGMMKSLGVKMSGEAKMRKLANKVILDYVVSVSLCFAFMEKSGKQKIPYHETATLAYIQDVEGLLRNLLDAYSAAEMLTWHDGTIPDDQIWIKIGGDHGKQSMKLTFQIINLQKTNAKQNVVFAYAPVPDSHENLLTLFEAVKMKAIFEALNAFQWKEKTLRVFIAGDYEFLTKIYGLSGASGTYPCLYCLMQKRHFNCTSSPEQRSRSLEGMEVNFQKYSLYMKKACS